MLIESQTLDLVFQGFSQRKYSLVIVSPQSLCSLASHFSTEPSEMARLLSRFFRSHGATYLVDSSFARLLSRRLHYDEFRRAFIDKVLIFIENS
jgi:hypothetical protein